jgi:hypothetical protein
MDNFSIMAMNSISLHPGASFGARDLHLESSLVSIVHLWMEECIGKYLHRVEYRPSLMPLGMTLISTTLRKNVKVMSVLLTNGG